MVCRPNVFGWPQEWLHDHPLMLDGMVCPRHSLNRLYTAAVPDAWGCGFAQQPSKGAAIPSELWSQNELTY